MLNVVLFGPPGAGKGTQSEFLVKYFKLIHLSTGNLFRNHLQKGTELGELIKGYINEGKLVPDQVVISMVEDQLNNNLDAKGFIFDGFPRTVSQAVSLDKMLKAHNLNINGMISLQVPINHLEKRLLQRGQTSGREDDQNLEMIKTRIEVYEQETKPVADFYNKKGKYNKICGVGTIKEISEKIKLLIGTLIK